VSSTTYDPTHNPIDEAVNDDKSPLFGLWWKVLDAIDELDDAGCATQYVHYKFARLREAMRLLNEEIEKNFPNAIDRPTSLPSE